MRLSPILRTGAFVAGALAVAQCLCAQTPAAPAVPVREVQGFPPRAPPAGFPAAAKAGSVTSAADFAQHSLPSAEGPLTTEDYLVVETGLFGPPGARLQMSYQDFSLRINGKKTLLPAQPYLLVFRSLKDPQWVPPDAGPSEQKSKTSIGGGGGQDSRPPPPPKMPIALVRAMEKRTEKASMPEGDRALPQAGLLFFEHRGSVRSLELIYNGPAGKATLTLHP